MGPFSRSKESCLNSSPVPSYRLCGMCRQLNDLDSPLYRLAVLSIWMLASCVRRLSRSIAIINIILIIVSCSKSERASRYRSIESRQRGRKGSLIADMAGCRRNHVTYTAAKICRRYLRLCSYICDSRMQPACVTIYTYLSTRASPLVWSLHLAAGKKFLPGRDWNGSWKVHSDGRAGGRSDGRCTNGSISADT